MGIEGNAQIQRRTTLGAALEAADLGLRPILTTSFASVRTVEKRIAGIETVHHHI